MPFARTKPLSEQNRILFKSLSDGADAAIRGRFGGRVAGEISEKLARVEHDEMLRAGRQSGLAIFASPEVFRVVGLSEALGPLLEVADSFHIKPLVRMMQQQVRFAVLCLSLNNVRVLEGDQHELNEVPLEQVPRNINETLEGPAANVPAEVYGQHLMHLRQPPTDKDNMGSENFFRAIDHALWEHYSRQARLPMIVCADPQHLAQFLSLTRNPDVLQKGIGHNPDHLSPDRLREEAIEVLRPRQEDQLRRLIDGFRAAKAHRHGSDELVQVAEAAARGRVGTLLVDEQARIPGVLHRASGLIEPAQTAANPGAQDLLDDLAELVLRKDGEVFVLPHEQMPTDAGLAAVYRY